MDKMNEMPVSRMDDQALQIHALGVAYREAERLREAAEEKLKELEPRRRAAEEKAERTERELRDLEAQMKEMTEAYGAVMKKNAALAAENRSLQRSLQDLRQAQERGQGA